MSARSLAHWYLASLFTLTAAPLACAAEEGMGARMRVAGEALIASVDAGKRQRLVLPFEGEARMDWHYTPRSRPGLSFAQMDKAQREAVHRLLKVGLSAVGHRKAVNIIELELVLRELEAFGSLMRDPEKYFVVFFGAPEARAPWGWRFEGHHLSLNFTVRGDTAVASTPSFFGANPAEVRKGPKAGLRILGAEEDEGRKLIGMFDAGQRTTAIVDARTYGEILTTNRDRVSPIDNRGLEARAMNAAQKAQLRKLIQAYADNFEPQLRDARLARSEEGFDSIRFAWAGSTERGRQHYYRVQGPRFLIELDSSQNDGNHVHTVWRDYDGDFGRDLLREHYAAARGSAHRH
ncbi:MAG: DUF3500 domain-containing protein [Usitatibacter sp.]